MATPPRRRILGVSLKMYFDLPQTLSYLQNLVALDPLAFNARLDLFVVPDFVALRDAAAILQPSSILLGAQNASHEDAGALTGEVSPMVLRQAGVRIVEVGHAERRRLFAETDDVVAHKAAAVARNGMVPLVCVGETTRPPHGGSVASAAVGAAVAECAGQITAVLATLPADADLVLAYEPVWAIGAAQPADADHVVAVAGELRRMVAERRKEATGTTRILYGGSAGPGTWDRIKTAVDGLFLGRFAHDLHNLKTVIEEVGAP